MNVVLIVIASAAVLCLVFLISDLAARGLWVKGYFATGFRVYKRRTLPLKSSPDMASIVNIIKGTANVDRYKREMLFSIKAPELCLFREKMFHAGISLGFKVSYIPLMVGLLQFKHEDKTLSVSGHITIGWPVALIMVLVMAISVFGFTLRDQSALLLISFCILLILIIGFFICFLLFRIQRKRFNLIADKLEELVKSGDF